MKKFLAALLIVGSLFFASTTVEAEVKTYTGTDDYTVGERETQEDAQNHSKLRALRNAQEQAGLYIRSRSRSKDLELIDDEIVTLTEGIVKIVGAPQYRKEILSDGKSILIHTTVTVQIDTEDVDRRLEEIARKHKPAPTTPIDRPQPIETPAPVETVIDDKAMANELLNLLNAERAKAGKKPFVVNEILTHAAKVRAEELSREPSNRRPNGTEWSTAVPMPYKTDCWHDGFWGADSPQQIVDWYMNQKSERKRILSSRYSKIGIAYFYKADSEHKHYWCILTSSR